MAASDDAHAHTPVLYHEVLSAIQPSAGSRYIDGTVGAAGHARGILLESEPDGLLLGLDLDPFALEGAQRSLAEFGSRVVLLQGSFRKLRMQLDEVGWGRVQGVLFDLGLSSMQLYDSSRGFSFLKEGPLDMRFNPSQELNAQMVVNEWQESDLSRILREYGEERFAKRISQAIVLARPIETTTQLAEVIVGAVPYPRSRIHPATRSFQALRIAVNDELGALSEGLVQAVEALVSGGRVAIISFHSLEDRIVKQFFRRESKDCICPPEEIQCACGHTAILKVITRKPIRPMEREINSNPRARSARLRVAERI